jgi:hypothetical protein
MERERAHKHCYKADNKATERVVNSIETIEEHLRFKESRALWATIEKRGFLENIHRNNGNNLEGVYQNGI